MEIKNKDKINPRCYKHGFAHTKLYMVWNDMKRRCDNPNREAYVNYGGRGIKVCNEWYDFNAFKNWALNNDYSETLILDRIENDGNYEPFNCRFINRFESELNKRRRSDYNIRFHKKRYCIEMRRYGIYYYASAGTIEEARILRDKMDNEIKQIQKALLWKK